MTTHTRRLATIALLTTLVSTVSAAPALAGKGSGGGDDEIRRAGSCSGTTDWKLKAKSDDGRLEVELEVDSNRVGQVWTVAMADNGARFFSGRRTTAGPSGSFEVERRTANRAGSDVITGTAKNPRTGETCRARLVFPS